MGLIVFGLAVDAQDRYYCNVTTYDSKDGFNPYWQTNSINQSHNGLVWIGTSSGLFSFDGKYFQSYKIQPQAKDALPINIVEYNYQDKDGRYWVYVFNKGLYNYNPHGARFIKVAAANEQQFNIHQYQVGAPFEDSKNNIWFPVLPYGIARYNKAANTFTPFKFSPPETKDIYRSIAWVNRFVEDPDDTTFWIVTNGGLVHFNPVNGKYEVYTDKEFLSKRPNEASTYISACFDTDKNLWIATWGQGLKKFDSKTKHFTTFLPYPKEIYGTRNVCNGVAVRDKNTLWVSSIDCGLLVFNKAETRFVPVFDYRTLQPVSSAFSFFQATDGSLWFSGNKKLMAIHDLRNRFSFYPFFNAKEPGKATGFAGSFVKQGNKLYIGAFYEGGFYQYNLQDHSFKKYVLPGKVQHYEVREIKPAATGNIWLTTTVGTFLFNTATEKYSQPQVITGDKKVFTYPAATIATDKQNGAWINTTNGLFYYDADAGAAIQYGQKISGTRHLPVDDIRAIFCDRNNTVWLGFYQYGIAYKKPADSSFHLLNTAPTGGSNGQDCESICESSDGEIIYTINGNGVSVIDHPLTSQQSIRVFNSGNGLYSDKVNDVYTDSKGHIWLLSEAGLSLFHTQSGKHIDFTEEDGLISGPEGCIYQDDEGYMYIGRENGFQVFYPDSLLAASLPPAEIHISGFDVNNAPYQENILPDRSDTISLKPSERNIHMRYAAVTTGFIGTVRYAYRLKGYDKDWIDATNARDITYTNIPPGKYVLQIKTGNSSGQWNQQFFSLPVIIATPWYQQLWFTGLCIIVVLFVLYGIFRVRINRVRKEAHTKAVFNRKIAEMEMKALRAQMNPHFIFNCLNSINRYIVKSDEKTASGYLTKFSKLIRLILDNSSSDTISLEKEIETLKLYVEMEALRYDHVFDYTFSIAEDINPEQVELPSMLIQPYVENAIWHGLLHKESGRGLLQVNIFKERDNVLIVTVTDNGIGRKKAAEIKNAETLKRKSYGIKLSKERLMLINNLYDMNASVHIEDLKDELGNALGTKAAIEIPFKN